MPLTFNVRHLDHQNLRLAGELPTLDLGLDHLDEMIRVGEQLKHDLEVERHERSFFVRGNLELSIHCECVRCLKHFERIIKLSNWVCLLALDGEEKVLIVNDCVDLTPYLRDDIVLAFPQHPLCEPRCCGLIGARHPGDGSSNVGCPAGKAASTWSQLDKLEL